MKTQKISSTNIFKIQKCPTSKSVANRLIILACLTQEEVKIKDVNFCDDVRLLIEALILMGIDIKVEKTTVIVYNSYQSAKKRADKIYLGEGGTTIRFLTIFSTLFEDNFIFKIHPNFLKRPQKELIIATKGLGCEMAIKHGLIHVEGKAKTNLLLEVDVARTTQVASALLLISEEINLKLKIVNLKNSLSYLEMTQNLLKNKSNSYKVAPDFSSLSYFVAWAALKQELVVENVKEIDELQADSKILNIYNKLGGSYEINDNGLHLSPITKFCNVDVDISDCLDLFPTLIFIFSYTGKRHKISGLKNLKYKESDRLVEGIKLLEKFEINYEVKEDSLIIEGIGTRVNRKMSIQTSFDHRMVMSALLFLKYNGGGICGPAESVSKSFPQYFQALGEST